MEDAYVQTTFVFKQWKDLVQNCSDYSNGYQEAMNDLQ